MSMAPCRCGQCQLCRVQDGLERYGEENATLRARVAELEEWYQNAYDAMRRNAEEAHTLRARVEELEGALESESSFAFQYAQESRDALERATRAESERDEYRRDVVGVSDALGIQYHMTQRIPSFVDTVRDWSRSYDRVIAERDEAKARVRMVVEVCNTMQSGEVLKIFSESSKGDTRCMKCYRGVTRLFAKIKAALSECEGE